MNNDDNYESKDQRVVRRWRQSWLRSNPPAPATDDEKACIDERMKGFKPKPYVHPHDDIIYEDEDETYPWERPGWDREAALHPGYVPPSADAAPQEIVVDAGENFAEMFEKFSAKPGDAGSVGIDDTPPTKADPKWTEPTPSEKARVTALVASQWEVAEMAKVMEISQDEFRWAYHDVLLNGFRQMKARFTQSLFADGLSRPGAARNRIADSMGVFKNVPKPPPAPTVQPRRQTEPRPRSAEPNRSVRGRNARRSRYGGAQPKPNPDGIIDIRMILGDTLNRGFDAGDQAAARKLELLIELRASRGQDRDGNPIDGAA